MKKTFFIIIINSVALTNSETAEVYHEDTTNNTGCSLKHLAAHVG